MSRTVAIMQPGYLPWLGYFDLVARADAFVLYDDAQFDKNGWRNRNRLLHDGGPQWITVPVSRGRLARQIRDVELAGSAWQADHVETIRHFYRRAPNFDFCFPAIEAYLTGCGYDRLLALCAEGHRVLCGLLGLSPAFQLSSEIGHAGAGRTERLVAICRDLGASRYLSPQAGREYMRADLWRDAGIDLVYQDCAHPVYPQYGAPFQSHLSALDALMFLGPAAAGAVGARPALTAVPS